MTDIDFADLKFAECVLLMQNTTLLIGAAGMGFANAMFMPRKAALLLVHPKHMFGSRHMWGNLAILCGQRVYFYRWSEDTDDDLSGWNDEGQGKSDSMDLDVLQLGLLVGRAVQDREHAGQDIVHVPYTRWWEVRRPSTSASDLALAKPEWFQAQLQA